jgi:N-acetylmuramoyl-L-alanine amidase
MAKEKIIVWDKGHSNTDPGAVGYVRERDVIVKTVDYAIAFMEVNYKCKNIETLPGDSLMKRCAKANAQKADLFVSVHFNSFKPEKGDGYEALVFGPETKDLGECFEKHVKSVGQNSRGVKYRPDLAVLKYTNMPAILNETAFVDTKADIKDWDEDHELKKMGEEYAKAAAEYLNLEKKKSSGTKYKTLTDLNLRKSADLKSQALDVVPKGTVLSGAEILGGWLKTKYNGKSGYVRVKGQNVYCERV